MSDNLLDPNDPIPMVEESCPITAVGDALAADKIDEYKMRGALEGLALEQYAMNQIMIDQQRVRISILDRFIAMQTRNGERIKAVEDSLNKLLLWIPILGGGLAVISLSTLILIVKIFLF